jgi:transposase
MLDPIRDGHAPRVWSVRGAGLAHGTLIPGVLFGSPVAYLIWDDFQHRARIGRCLLTPQSAPTMSLHKECSMSLPSPSSIIRFFGVDLHKHFLYIAAVNSLQEIVLKPLKIPLENWPAWARDHLLPTDIVAVESTTNSWDFYDGIVSFVARVEIANAGKLPWIGLSRVKTDKLDAIKLAKLCAAGLIPLVWVPPFHIREARCLLAHRRRLVGIQTMTRNRLHSLLHRHMLELPPGGPFSDKNLAWWDSLPLSPTEKILLRHSFETLDHLKPQIAQLDAEISRLSDSPEWRDPMTFTLQIPGFGVTLGLTILSAIGDISRFESPKKLVGYSGLGASVHSSGQTFRQGRITKSGRRDLRTALIEAAWAAVNFDPYWKQEFDRLSQRLVPGKAIVAIARRLLVVLWHVLSKRQSYRHLTDNQIASKMMRWSWKVRKYHPEAVASRLFIRRRLMTLGVGKNLSGFKYNNLPRALASEEEASASTP